MSALRTQPRGRTVARALRLWIEGQGQPARPQRCRPDDRRVRRLRRCRARTGAGTGCLAPGNQSVRTWPARVHQATRSAGQLRGRNLEGTETMAARRSEEHTSELQSLMRISYAVFCLKKKKHKTYNKHNTMHTHR